MTNEQAKSELMQIYMSLSEEKKKALDVAFKAMEQAQADGEYISRTELLKAIDTWDKFGVDDTNSLFRLDNLSLPHYVAYIHYDDVIKCIKGMPSVTPKPKTGHCKDCKCFRKLPLRTDTSIGKCIQHWGVCPPCDWYCADFESQESEE